MSFLGVVSNFAGNVGAYSLRRSSKEGYSAGITYSFWRGCLEAFYAGYTLSQYGVLRASSSESDPSISISSSISEILSSILFLSKVVFWNWFLRVW